MKTRLLSFALALCLPASATAGTIYTFALEGTGVSGPPLGGGGAPFSSAAELTIRYDPADSLNDRMDLSIDDIGYLGLGYTIETHPFLTYLLAGPELIIGGSGPLGILNVVLDGAPGPLAPNGLPQSLDGFSKASGHATGGYHEPLYSFTFATAAALPEPSSWMLLAAGVFGAIGLISLARAWLPCR